MLSRRTASLDLTCLRRPSNCGDPDGSEDRNHTELVAGWKMDRVQGRRAFDESGGRVFGAFGEDRGDPNGSNRVVSRRPMDYGGSRRGNRRDFSGWRSETSSV